MQSHKKFGIFLELGDGRFLIKSLQIEKVFKIDFLKFGKNW